MSLRSRRRLRSLALDLNLQTMSTVSNCEASPQNQKLIEFRLQVGASAVCSQAVLRVYHHKHATHHYESSHYLVLLEIVVQGFNG